MDTERLEIEQKERMKREKRTFFREFLFLLVISMLLFGAYSLGYDRGGSEARGESAFLDVREVNITNKERSDKDLDFSLFWKVWDLLKERYVDRDSLDARKLLYGAIDGMLSASGDPYTTFFDPEESKEFEEEISGSFEGIGAEMGIKDKVLTIIAPLEGMPAEKAGLLPGDRVLKINGETTEGLALDIAVKKIRGKKGTEVTLTIFREGEEETRDVKIVRDTISVKSVRYEEKEGGIAYLRVNRFGEETMQEFRLAARDMIVKKPKGIILDLRNNPGGLLESSIDMAGWFLSKNSVAVIEENSRKDRKELRTDGAGEFQNIPVVILLNEGSASASEILAGALNDNRNEAVTLLGETSFGKGSVQELISVSKTTKVKVTVARWLTPKGNQINEVGIAPEIEVGIASEDIQAKRDPQLDRAMEILQGVKR